MNHGINLAEGKSNLRAAQSIDIGKDSPGNNV